MKAILNHLIEGKPATASQVSRVIDMLMTGKLDPAYGGAFLALQMKNGITGDQLKAALDIMMKYASTIELDDPFAVDNCGTGGDGGSFFNVSTTACFVIAGAGHTVAKHGNRAVSSSCGSADLLEAVGVNLKLEPDQIQDCINETGIGFMFAPIFHPAMRFAAPIRRGLGVRTMFNMLGPLANPAGVHCQLIGVFCEELTELLAEVLAQNGKTAFVVYGEDGSDEISLTTRTKITEVKNGRFESKIFDPRRHNFRFVSPEALAGGTLKQNKSIFESVLQNREKGPAMEMVILNAGFAMYTTSNYKELDDAFLAARASVESGAAWAKVQELVSWTRDHQEAPDSLL